ncbi:TRAP transporter substrate-binding protein [Paramicrobacterium humi]|nr:TRAP transporter substrate-binding protein [Microbacterium humi]
MKGLAVLGVFAVGAMALAGCARGGAVEGSKDESGLPSYTLTIGSSVAASTPVNQGALRFKDTVEKKTDGRVTVEVYPAEQLGSEPEMIEGLELGSVSIAIVATAVLADTCPQFGAYALPYVIEGDTSEEQYANLRKLTGSKFNEDIVEKCAEDTGNLVVDNSWWYGNRNLTTRSTEVNVPEDMRGLDIRTPPADLHTMGIKAFGAQAVPMAFSEVYTALDTGVIDGQENPISTIYENALFEVQDYLSLTKHMTQNQTLVMNNDFFEGLPKEDQDLIRDALDEAGEWQSNLQLKTNAEQLEKLKDKGMNVIEPDLAPFKAAVEDVRADWLKQHELSAEDLSQIQK